MKRFYLLPIVCCALSISLSAQREQRHCNHLRCRRQPHPQRRQPYHDRCPSGQSLSDLAGSDDYRRTPHRKGSARQAGVRPAPPYPEPPRRQCLRCRERASRRHRDEWRAAVGRPGSHRYPGRQSNHPQHRAALFLAAQHPLPAA